MTERTKTWPQITKDRLAASQMLPYIMSVVDGQESEPCPHRLNTCIKMLNKVLPDMKAVELSTEGDGKFEFHAHLHNDS